MLNKHTSFSIIRSNTFTIEISNLKLHINVIFFNMTISLHRHFIVLHTYLWCLSSSCSWNFTTNKKNGKMQVENWNLPLPFPRFCHPAVVCFLFSSGRAGTGTDYRVFIFFERVPVTGPIATSKNNIGIYTR